MWLTPQCSHVMPQAVGTSIVLVGGESYPHVDGIFTLKDRRTAREEIEELCAAIRKGGRVAASQCLKRWDHGWGDGDNLDVTQLKRVFISGEANTGVFVDDWIRCVHGRDHYFLVRWAAPSHLTALALLPLLCGGTLLDVACGAGHIAGLVAGAAPKTDLYLADFNFLHAIMAKAYFAPDASVACLDFNAPLPLPDAVFDTVLISDALHYCEEQELLLAEAMRVLRKDGELFIIHAHDPRNLACETVPGEPAPQRRYVEWLRSVDPSVAIYGAAEQTFLQRIAAGVAPDCALIEDIGAEPPGPYLLRAVRGGGAGRPCQTLRYVSDHVFLNPIYRVAPDGAGAALDWPSEAFFREFGHTPLPAQIALDIVWAPQHRIHFVRNGILVPEIHRQEAVA